MPCCCGNACACACGACTCGGNFAQQNALLYAVATNFHDRDCCHTESMHDITDYDMADDGRQPLTDEQKKELMKARHWWQKL